MTGQLQACLAGRSRPAFHVERPDSEGLPDHEVSACEVSDASLSPEHGVSDASSSAWSAAPYRRPGTAPSRSPRSTWNIPEPKGFSTTRCQTPRNRLVIARCQTPRPRTLSSEPAAGTAPKGRASISRRLVAEESSAAGGLRFCLQCERASAQTPARCRRDLQHVPEPTARCAVGDLGKTTCQRLPRMLSGACTRCHRPRLWRNQRFLECCWREPARSGSS